MSEISELQRRIEHLSDRADSFSQHFDRIHQRRIADFRWRVGTAIGIASVVVGLIALFYQFYLGPRIAVTNQAANRSRASATASKIEKTAGLSGATPEGIYKEAGVDFGVTDTLSLGVRLTNMLLENSDYSLQAMQGGNLRSGDTAVFYRAFEEGNEYLIVGICDLWCYDIDLALYDRKATDTTPIEDATPIRSDVLNDDVPVIRYIPTGTEELSIQTRMISCDSESCGWRANVYVKSKEEVTSDEETTPSS